MKRVITTGVFLSVMAMFFLFPGCGLQRTLLYHPERFTMEEVQRYARQFGLEPWPAGNSSYLGLISRDHAPSPRGTVVVFHGNAGSAVHRSYYADALVPRGFRVIVAEYPGYGARSGKMSEESFTDDARLIAEVVREQFDGPLYFWGESLGAAVAAAAVSDSTLVVEGLALITPWDTLYNLARAKLPIFPAGFFMRDKYDSAKNLVGYSGPKSVLMAERDEIIPPRLTRRLYESMPEPKRFWLFEQAGHNTWPTDSRLQWWDEVAAYLESTGAE